MKALLLLCILAFPGIVATAQPWMSAPYFKPKRSTDPSAPANFYDIQEAFNRYEKKQLRKTSQVQEGDGRKNEGTFAGYKQYKRWEDHMEPRVYPSGDITLPSTNYKEFEAYQTSLQSNTRSSTLPPATWTALGPTGTVSNGDFYGAARVNFLRFDPTNSDIMWTVSPLGGLWKSIDAGLNWTNSNTDQLPIIGCSDIAIDPVINVTGLSCKDLTLAPGANLTVPEGHFFKTKGN